MFKNFIPHLIILFCFFSATGSATNYYSDPSAAGSMSNSGSFASPWANLSSIFAANKTFQAGDTIFLRTGNHGYAIIRGINTGFVVITPQPGQTPIIDRIRVSASAAIAAAYWKLDGLTVQSEATGTMANPSYTLLEIYPHATNITISNCIITSNLNTIGWTRQDWRNRCNSGLSTRGKINANYIIENNLIKNTAFGLSISSSNTIVRGNTVQNFTNDGSRVVGSDIIFENNRVQDLIKVMTNLENHDDLFQSFTYPAGGTGQDTLKNNIIRNNIFISCTDTTRAFRGPAQGIGCFDGVFLNWITENNIVITDHWHGISFYGAVNCKIINNTVIDPYLYTPIDSIDHNATNIGPAWILINKKTNGPNSTGNIVKNNLVANNVIFNDPSMGVASNNIVLGAIANFSNYFADVSNFGLPGNFDLHLKSGAPAIDAGNSIDAPLTDYDGIPRPQGLGFDIGAYEYVDNTLNSGEPESQGDISVYPNPSTGKFRIEFTSLPLSKNYTVEIYNLLGERIYADNLSTSTEISLQNSPKGIYFIVVYGEGRSVYSKKILLN